MRIFHSHGLQAGLPKNAGRKKAGRRIELRRQKQPATSEFRQGLPADFQFAQAAEAAEPGNKSGQRYGACFWLAGAALTCAPINQAP
jgi:hypothetical protein